MVVGVFGGVSLFGWGKGLASVGIRAINHYALTLNTTFTFLNTTISKMKATCLITDKKRKWPIQQSVYNTKVINTKHLQHDVLCDLIQNLYIVRSLSAPKNTQRKSGITALTLLPISTGVDCHYGDTTSSSSLSKLATNGFVSALVAER